MQTSSSFIQFSKWVLIMVILVIIAGAVVRMTQSGMGCPDWPKCFGKWIPPTNASELPPDFEKYLKQQDIDHTFNVFHTWTEYVNRLFGATLGLLLLIQFGWSLKFWKKNRLVVLLVFGNLLLTSFQGWLGKRVVDANLATIKITTHMLVALLIAALAYSVIEVAQQKEKWVNKKVKHLSLIALVLLIGQIVLGTQVREQIDGISKSLAYGGREQWIEKLDVVFLIHRSFSLLLIAICGYLYLAAKKETNNWANKLMLISILAEVLLGIIMAYANMPAFAQPLHLLFSALLFLSLFAQWISVKAQKDLIY